MKSIFNQMNIPRPQGVFGTFPYLYFKSMILKNVSFKQLWEDANTPPRREVFKIGGGDFTFQKNGGV